MAGRSTTAAEQWAFICDWLDPNSGVRWTYQLFAYVSPDGSPVEVEMVSTRQEEPKNAAAC